MGQLSNDIQARSSRNNFCVVPHHLHLLHHHYHPHLQRLQQPATNFQLYLLKPSDANQTTEKWTPSERRCSLSKVRLTPCMQPSPDLKEQSKNPTPRMMSTNVLSEIWARRSKLMR